MPSLALPFPSEPAASAKPALVDGFAPPEYVGVPRRSALPVPVRRVNRLWFSSARPLTEPEQTQARVRMLSLSTVPRLAGSWLLLPRYSTPHGWL